MSNVSKGKIQLPDEFKSGEPIRASEMDKLRQAIAFALKDMIGGGRGITVSQSSGKYLISARNRPRGGAGTSHPWKPYLSPFLGEEDPPADQPLRIRITPGTVANRLPANWNEEVILPAFTNGRWVWLEVTIIDSGAVTGAFIKQGASVPTADLVSSDGALPTTLYAPLFAVDTGESGVERFYVVQNRNLEVAIINNDGLCADQLRSVQLVDASSTFNF